MSNVIWVTGLSGSGKTTLATQITKAIRDRNIPVIMLDGDILRETLGIEGKNARHERIEIGFTYSRLCKMIAAQEINVVIATIALFKQIHAWNRENIDNYFEIFLDVPIQELARRDTKGLYKKAKEAGLKDVAGLDLEVDFPSTPDLLFKYSKDEDPGKMKDKVLSLVFD